MPSIGKLIFGDNKKILSRAETVPPCNCMDEDCPLDGSCQESKVIYQCSVKEANGGTSETYIGLTGNTFKNRYYKHKKSFNTKGYQTNTHSSHIWNLKQRNINYELSWRIVSKARTYSPSSKICELCIREAYFIMFERNKSTLNSRNEFFNYCLHKDRFLLQNQ